MNLVRFFTGILFGRPKEGGMVLEQVKRPDDDRKAFTTDSAPNLPAVDLQDLRNALEQVIELLIDPTPAAIREAGVFLESADEQLRQAARQRREHPKEQLRQIEVVMLRARRLIEGALRIRWAQMRRITTLTQTYMSGGKLLQFYPADPRLDLKV